VGKVGLPASRKQGRMVILVVGGNNAVYWTGCYVYRKAREEFSLIDGERALMVVS
jgi:hypothetical protein